MTDASTTLQVGRHDSTILVRIGGRVTAEFCPALKAFCSETGQVSCEELHVDLQECRYFDSTFLGTLLCLRGKFGEDNVVIVSPSKECLEGLKRMGAHVLFAIRDGSLPEEIEWTSLAENVTERDTFDFQHNVLEAHIELARVPGPMQKVYEPIARQAQKEFEQKFSWDTETVKIPRPK